MPTVAEPVTVVLSADDAYARPLTVAAMSVVATLSADLELDLCVLDMGIKAEKRRLIEKTFATERVRVRWIDSLQGGVGHLPNTWSAITRATYARLFIPDVLPDAPRALYFDCDVMARRCVGSLFASEMDGFTALASPDVQSPFVTSQYAVPYWFDAGRSPDEYNFNAGVMLMDLDAWRRLGITDAALEYLTDGRHHFAQDQEALNVVLAGRIGEMDPRWNQQQEMFWKEHEVMLPYSSADVAQLRDDPWIVHFSNQPKPWHHGLRHPFLDEWFGNLDRTCFGNWRPTYADKVTRRGRQITKSVARRVRAASTAARDRGLFRDRFQS